MEKERKAVQAWPVWARRMCAVVGLGVILAGCVGAEESTGPLAAADATEAVQTQQTALEQGAPDEEGCIPAEPERILVDVGLGQEGELPLGEGATIPVLVTNQATEAVHVRLRVRILTEAERRDVEVAEFDMPALSTQEVPIDATALNLPTDVGTMSGRLEFKAVFNGATFHAGSRRHKAYFHHDAGRWHVYSEAVRDTRYNHGARDETARQFVEQVLRDAPTSTIVEDGRVEGVSPPSVGLVRVTVSPLRD